MKDKQFQNLLTIAKNRLFFYMEHKDETAMRLAAFACGRVVGFYLANGSPAEWSAEIDMLQISTFNTIGSM